MSAFLKATIESTLAEIAETARHGIAEEEAMPALLRIQALVGAMPRVDRRNRARVIRDRISRDTGQLLLLTSDEHDGVTMPMPKPQGVA